MRVFLSGLSSKFLHPVHLQRFVHKILACKYQQKSQINNLNSCIVIPKEKKNLKIDKTASQMKKLAPSLQLMINIVHMEV